MLLFQVTQMTMPWCIFVILRTVYVSSKSTTNPCLHKYQNGFSEKNYSACCNIRPLMVVIPSNNIYRLLQFNLFVILESWWWWDAQSNVTVCSQEPRCERLLIEKEIILLLSICHLFPSIKLFEICISPFRSQCKNENRKTSKTNYSISVICSQFVHESVIVCIFIRYGIVEECKRYSIYNNS